MSTENNQAENVKTMQKGEGVTDAERYLQKLAEKSFLSLWSYPNPYKDGHLTRSRGTKQEVCDLLVVFENHLIIFADKTCAFQDKGNLDLDWSRWYRNAVLDNAKQIWGAEKHILKNPDNLFLDPTCTKPFPIDLPSPDKVIVHRIVVAHAASERCKKELGGSGSLMIKPDIAGNQHTAKREDGGILFAIGQIDPARGYVHVFDDTTLKIVMETLDTIADFVAYLQKKEQFVTTGKLLDAAGEEDLLAYYLQRMNDQEEHDFVLPSGVQQLSVPKGEWKKFASGIQRHVQLEANEVSYAWDGLIETFLNHIYGGTSYYSSHTDLADHEPMYRFMARENRTRRRMLARSLLEFIDRITPTQRATRTMKPSRPGDPYYVFMVMPHLASLSYEEYREARREHLLQCCLIAKVNFPDAHDIIGIATESGRKKEGSEDLIYFDAREWTLKQQTECENMLKEFKAQKMIGAYMQTVGVEEEYPDVPTFAVPMPRNTPVPEMKGRDRNAPCWCGSGKKFKKCHG